jgi:hypothetical protein
VTTIDPRSPLNATLQAHLAQLRARARSTDAARGKPASAEVQSAAQALAQRVQAIAPDDPQRQRKAVRVFLEQELAQEFGPALLNDPAFPAMLDAVQDQMQQDAQAAEAVQRLGELLLAKSGV